MNPSKHIVILLALALTGCVSITGAAMKKLQPGMSKEQAMKITGPADGYQAENGVEVYIFTDRAIDINSPNRADFQMTFNDGRLVQWGANEVRKSNIGMVGVFGNISTN